MSEERTMEPDTISVDRRHHTDVREKERRHDEDEADGRDESPKSHTKMMDYYIPWTITSFAELDEVREAGRYTQRIGELTEELKILLDNIIYSEEISDKPAAIAALTSEYAERVSMSQDEMETKDAGLLSKMRQFFSGNDLGTKQEEEKDQPFSSGFFIWKEQSGRHRWFATYSNRYRDQDNPPEIISEKSQSTFVDLVDKGIVDYPELWHWHIPGTRWGKADWLAYADGFALASGLVDEGHEKEAEALAQSTDPLLASHGMPLQFLKRNPDDRSVIDFHITTEISPLPSWAAANRLTGFELLETESNMALPKEKRAYLKDVVGLDDDRINAIEDGIARKAKEAAEEGMEFKEGGAPAETADSEPAETPPASPAPAEPTESAEFVTSAELVETLGEVAVGFTRAIQSLNAQMAELATEVKEMRRSDGERIAEKAANTPQASLASLIFKSAIGADETRVDGRSSLAKDGPHEIEAKEGTGLFFEDWMKSSTVTSAAERKQ